MRVRKGCEERGQGKTLWREAGIELMELSVACKGQGKSERKLRGPIRGKQVAV